MRKDNYGNTLLEPGDLIKKEDRGGAFVDVVAERNAYLEREYEQEVKRARSHVGCRWGN